MPALKRVWRRREASREAGRWRRWPSKNWAARRKTAGRADIRNANERSPIDPDWLALQVVEAMPAGRDPRRRRPDVVAPDDRHLRPHRDRYGYHALASGGIGWGLPASVGVSPRQSRAARWCATPVTAARCIRSSRCGRAAHHKLPLTFVIVNNGGYRIIKQRLLAFHGDDHYVGMDFVDPPVDFTGHCENHQLGLEAIKGERSRRS